MAVPQHEVVRDILFRLCTGKREQQSFNPIFLQFLFTLRRAFQPGTVHIIEEDDMFEPERKPVYDSRRDKSRFRIETDRMEAVCRQAHHVLFSACDKEQITFCRQLFQPETVVVAKITGVQEPHL